MNAFKNITQTNLLSGDGIVNYFGKVLTPQNAQYYLDRLLKTIEWKNDEAIIFGRHIITKRKVAWYADTNYEYTYSNRTKLALHWTKELLELKKLVDEITGTTFNSCLLNLYHSGDEGMAWHSDDEKTLQKDSPIASLSFGAERKIYDETQTNETNHFSCIRNRKLAGNERNHSKKMAALFAKIKENKTSKSESHFQDHGRK